MKFFWYWRGGGGQWETKSNVLWSSNSRLLGLNCYRWIQQTFANLKSVSQGRRYLYIHTWNIILFAVTTQLYISTIMKMLGTVMKHCYLLTHKWAWSFKLILAVGRRRTRANGKRKRWKSLRFWNQYSGRQSNQFVKQVENWIGLGHGRGASKWRGRWSTGRALRAHARLVIEFSSRVWGGQRARLEASITAPHITLVEDGLSGCPLLWWWCWWLFNACKSSGLSFCWPWAVVNALHSAQRCDTQCQLWSGG